MFFECGPSKRLWHDVLAKCLQKHIRTDWASIVRQGLKFWKGKTFCATLCRLACDACVFNIWKHRNSLKYGSCLISEEKILQNVCWEGRSRLLESLNPVLRILICA